MKRIRTIVSWMVELAIVAVLLWKHYEMYCFGWYDFDALFLLLLLSPLFLGLHWVQLRKEHLPRKIRLKLFLLTGPAVFLCLTLIMGLTCRLKRVGVFGGVPKEVVAEVNINRGNPPNPKDNAYGTRFMSEKLSRSDVVSYLALERMKSDGLLYAMLLASTIILYGNRYSLGRLEYSEGPPTCGGEK